MAEHVHKWSLRGTRLIGGSGRVLDQVIYGLCECGEELEEAEITRRLNDREALLAVVRVTQIELGMSVPELLRIVAKDIETDSEIEAVDVLAMWLRRMADELEKTLAALPEHLKTTSNGE